MQHAANKPVEEKKIHALPIDVLNVESTWSPQCCSAQTPVAGCSRDVPSQISRMPTQIGIPMEKDVKMPSEPDENNGARATVGNICTGSISSTCSLEKSRNKNYPLDSNSSYYP